MFATPPSDLNDACRTILGTMSAALSIRDENFVPLFANQAYLDLFEVDLEVWMQGRLAAHIGTESADFLNNEVLPRLMAGEKWQGQLKIVTPKGAKKEVLAELSPVFNKAGKITNFYALYSEITPLKELKSQLLIQNEFLNQVIDTLPDPIIVKDENHSWITVNKAFCKISGRTRNELIGKSDYDFFPKEEADVFWQQDDLALQSGEEVENEETITSKDGTRQRISTKKVTFTTADGARVVIAMARDITAQRNLERTIAQSYRHLEAGLTSLKHELESVQSNLTSGASKADALRALLVRSNDSFTQYIDSAEEKPSNVRANPLPEQLSSREYQVFILLAQGLRVKQIAEHLAVSSNTVSTYRSRVMKKLGLKSLTELVQYAMRYGLI